jgi:hypothetical protein
LENKPVALKYEIDKTATNPWLNVGELVPEAAGFIIAIQDKVISTINS